MPYYLLCWGLEGGLVTVDLTSGIRLILVHSDQQLAAEHMAALSRRTGREVAVIEIESAKRRVKERLESIVGVGLLSDVDLAFPNDPIYLVILHKILADIN